MYSCQMHAQCQSHQSRRGFLILANIYTLCHSETRMLLSHNHQCAVSIGDPRIHWKARTSGHSSQSHCCQKAGSGGPLETNIAHWHTADPFHGPEVANTGLYDMMPGGNIVPGLDEPLIGLKRGLSQIEFPLATQQYSL